MADYWKSNDRKYCDFCKCWISDNKASISFHENGKRHKMNVAKRITDISKSSEKAEKERKKIDSEIRKMEEAAMRSYAHDIHARGDFTARSLNAVMGASVESGGTSKVDTSLPRRQIDPIRLPGNSDDEDDNKTVSIRAVAPESVPDASLWVEGYSDDGYPYYWNVKTNESIWEAPKEGYMSWAEYQKINDIALQQQEIRDAEEAKKFREGANEEVARYNRERLKIYRKTEVIAQEKKEMEEQRQKFKTQDEANGGQIGVWQIVEDKPPPKPIDLQLPQTNNKYIPPPVTSEVLEEPPVKRFKEKTIERLDPEVISNTSTAFKKRKLVAKSNARTRLNDD